MRRIWPVLFLGFLATAWGGDKDAGCPANADCDASVLSDGSCGRDPIAYCTPAAETAGLYCTT